MTHSCSQLSTWPYIYWDLVRLWQNEKIGKLNSWDSHCGSNMWDFERLYGKTSGIWESSVCRIFQQNLYFSVKFLTTFWSILTNYDLFLTDLDQFLTDLDQFWPILTNFNWVLPDIEQFCPIFDRFWPILIFFGLFWPILTDFR